MVWTHVPIGKWDRHDWAKAAHEDLKGLARDITPYLHRLWPIPDDFCREA